MTCCIPLHNNNRRRNSRRHRTHRNNRLRRGFGRFDVLTWCECDTNGFPFPAILLSDGLDVLVGEFYFEKKYKKIVHTNVDITFELRR